MSSIHSFGPSVSTQKLTTKSATARSVSTWVKPVAYTALAIGGVALAVFAYHQGLFSSQQKKDFDLTAAVMRYKNALNCTQRLYPSETDAFYKKLLKHRPAIFPGANDTQIAQFHVIARDVERECAQNTMSPMVQSVLRLFNREKGETHTYESFVEKYKARGYIAQSEIDQAIIESSKRPNQLFHHPIVIQGMDILEAGYQRPISGMTSCVTGGLLVGHEIGKVHGLLKPVGGLLGCIIASFAMTGVTGAYNSIPDGTWAGLKNRTFEILNLA